VVVGLYALLTVALHYQVLKVFGTAPLGYNSPDKHLHLWDNWWAWTSLTELKTSFFFTPYINHPPGVSLWEGNSGFLLPYFTVPLQWLTGNPISTYNLTILLSLLMSCLGGFWLARRLGAGASAAFCAGAVLAFNPLTSFFLVHGFIEYLNLGFGALFLLATVKLVDEGGAAWAVKSVVWFAMAATWCWYIGFLLLLTTALWFLYRSPRLLAQVKVWPRLRSLLLWGGMILAFLLLTYANLSNPELGTQKAELESEYFANDDQIRRIVLQRDSPQRTAVYYEDGHGEDGSKVHLDWLELKLVNSIDPIRAFREPMDSHERSLYFIFWLIPFALIAAAAPDLRRGRNVFFFATATTFFLLSLGPCLIFDREVLLWTHKFMPSTLGSLILPGLDRVQFPIRYLFGALFCMSILAGQGFTRLARLRWRGTVLEGVLHFMVIGGLSLSYFHLNHGEVHHEEIEIPAYYQRLAETPGDFTILEIPFNRQLGLKDIRLPNHDFSTYQTIHGKRRLGGHIPGFLTQKNYPAGILENPFLDAVEAWSLNEFAAPGDLRPERIAEGLESLRSLGFRYIIFHTIRVPPMGRDEALGVLDQALGEPEVDETTWDRLRVYELQP